MRWSHKPYPRNGEFRERRVFAWLPIRADDGHTYWLVPLWVCEQFHSGWLEDCWVKMAVKPA